MASLIRLLVVAAVLFAMAGCDSGGEGAPLAAAGVEVRGVAITTTGRPDIDPTRVCGRPTRTAALITAVPNPYLGRSTYETRDDGRILRFTNLPNRVRIEIVRAYWYATGPAPPERWVGGGLARVVPSTGQAVRVLEKDSPSRSFDWDLRDERGGLVPSGFYRAFFTVDAAAAVALELGGTAVFDDLYIVQREDLATWRDPTGCL